MAHEPVIDGRKCINSSDHPTHDTSKSGYPIVETGAAVRCECGDIHEARWRNSDAGLDVPMGHGRYSHFTCPNGEGYFAAEKASKLK